MPWVGVISFEGSSVPARSYIELPSKNVFPDFEMFHYICDSKYYSRYKSIQVASWGKTLEITVPDTIPFDKLIKTPQNCELKRFDHGKHYIYSAENHKSFVEVFRQIITIQNSTENKFEGAHQTTPFDAAHANEIFRCFEISGYIADSKEFYTELTRLIQANQFSQVLEKVKAMHNEEDVLVRLGQICEDAKDYNNAMRCYEAIPQSNPHYYSANKRIHDVSMLVQTIAESDKASPVPDEEKRQAAIEKQIKHLCIANQDPKNKGQYQKELNFLFLNCCGLYSKDRSKEEKSPIENVDLNFETLFALARQTRTLSQRLQRLQQDTATPSFGMRMFSPRVSTAFVSATATITERNASDDETGSLSPREASGEMSVSSSSWVSSSVNATATPEPDPEEIYTDYEIRAVSLTP